MELQNFKIMDEHTIRIYDSGIVTNDISKALTLHDVEINAIGTKSESLEDYFLKLTEEESRSC